jgi:hypothetical protein
MTPLALPALRSDDPLGFLAAIGLVEVCTSCLGMPVKLSWEGLGGQAILTGEEGLTLEELAGLLAAEAGHWLLAGRLAPPDEPHFIAAPLSDIERKARREGGQTVTLDPMRLSLAAATARFEAQSDAELHGDAVGARWLVGLVCQLGREQNGDLRELTPLYARTGRQNLHQMYGKYLASVANRPQALREALVSWRRDPGYLGVNLDARAIRDAAFSTEGKPENADVPGATWLALMSVPFFPLSGDGTHPFAVGWLSARPGGRPRDLCWPVWRIPLDRTAISVLLAHPLVRAAANKKRPSRLSRLSQLGVEAVLRSSRATLTNSDGPLQAPEVIWP